MDLFEEIVKMRRGGQRGALATIVHTNGSIPSYESSRMLVREDGSMAGTIGGGCVEAEVWAAAKEVMQKEAPRKMVFHLNNEASYDNGLICGGTLEVFVEPILPRPVVYLFGGGHVSMAVAKAAHAAGFGIVVVDDREAFANKERFPMAQATVATRAQTARFGVYALVSWAATIPFVASMGVLDWRSFGTASALTVLSAGAETTIVPDMTAPWTVHKYPYVPGTENCPG